MKSLFLIANTPLQTIELALEKVAKRIQKLHNEKITYEILFGRGFNFSKCYNADFVILFGPNSYRLNQDQINAKSIGLMMGDPMNLDCITTGDAVTKMDFRAKEDGFGYYLNKLEVMDVAKMLYSAYTSKKATRVDIKDFEAIPTIIGAIKDKTSFVQDLAALTYTVRDEATRARIKRTFMNWALSDEKSDGLEKRFLEATSATKSNKRIQSILDLFDSKQGAGIRKAVKSVLLSVKSKKSGFNFERTAETYGISAFDLRYIANLARKDTLFIENLDSTIAHYNNAKVRYVEDDYANDD